MSSHTVQQWHEGERWIARLQPHEQLAADVVVDRLVAELRRRLGGTFTTRELAELYDQGTSWCLQLATQTAPGAPWAWDARVFDAAFARYVRGAVDYAGGRTLQEAD